MAKSTSSQHRAQLLREMNRTRPASASSRRSHGPPSPGNTLSDVFDPENEAIMSTRILEDVSQKLPQLRKSAEKYRRPDRLDTLKDDSGDILNGMEWDTSALRRHFPDFTQGSESPDNSRLTEWEMGRAAVVAEKARANGEVVEYISRGDSFEGDTLDRQRHFIDGDELMYTPPVRSKQLSKKTDNLTHESLRRDMQVRQPLGLRKGVPSASPPPAKTKDSGSDQSRKASGDSRRTLAAMHARVRDENDKSVVEEDRPPTVELTSRNTRFTNTRSQNAAPIDVLPSRFSSAQGLMGALAPKKKAHGHTTSTHTPQHTQTQRSFDIPSAPNLTELMSGVFETGQPVFSREGKSRTSRFVSLSQKGPCASQVDRPVEDIAVKLEEQHIYMNIHLLQDKIAVLEKNRAELMNDINELKHKNQVLEAKRESEKRRSASDSALGTTDSDSGDEVRGGYRKLLIEKNRLQSSIYTLQAQADSSNRKTATTETILKNVTEERDAAVSQLGVAWFTTEQLKGENQSIRAENDDLKAQIAQLNDNLSKETQQMCGELGKLKTMIHEQDVSYVAKGSERLKGETRNLRSRMAQLSSDHHDEIQRCAKDSGRLEENVNDLESRAQATANYQDEAQDCLVKAEAMRRMLERRAGFVENMKEGADQQGSGREEKRAPASRSENQRDNVGQAQNSIRDEVDALFDFRRNQDVTNKAVNVGQQATKIDGWEDGEDAAHFTSQEKGKGRARVAKTPTNYILRDGTSLDLTYLSFVDPKEISQLRKTLEQERIERKQREKSRRQATKGDNDITQSALFDLTTQQAVPRKSSMKDLTVQSVHKDATQRSFQEHLTERSLRPKESTEQNRRRSETSLVSIRSRRHDLNAGNMTSAFIIPDITVRNPVVDDSQIPKVTEQAQKVLDGIANHDGQNCTVCKRVVNKNENHEHAREVVKILKPIPVSDRILSATENEEDHTMRPSQAPGVALAIVMKGLEDELTHLKIQLTRYHTLYNGQDPALSKRSRKSVHNKIETLLQFIDTKADQIYALYDVLESQKQDGRELREEEVEVTLQSLGIDIGTLHLRGGGDEKQPAEKNSETSERHPWDLESEGESDLPWEGIESTLESTRGGFSKAGRRKSTAN